MKRPSDQAKLLLFALLRSTATALATTGDKSTVPKLLLPNIQLRLATRTDVPSLHRCNLACLPENYNAEFYQSHLQQWPGLALVAEHVQEPHVLGVTTSSSNTDASRYHSQQQQQQPAKSQHFQSHLFHNYHNRPVSSQPMYSDYANGVGGSGSRPQLRQQQQQQQQPQRDGPQIIAYVLGKVEQRPKYDYSLPDDEQLGVETIGHVTSLAVMQEYRRQGLAQALMKQLHFHLEHYQAPPTQYSHGHKVAVTGCGLHVRKSNAAACRLYENDGYEIEQVIRGYYQDGEDAFFMKKRLVSAAGRQDSTSLLHRYSGRQCWHQGGGPTHMRLPRRHEHNPELYNNNNNLNHNPFFADTTDDEDESSTSSTSSSNNPGLLTGTM
jgi:ribosomal protein S18 acetylase RimI-like enzyme